MIVNDDLFQKLLDRVAELERKVAIINHQQMTPKEAAHITENTPMLDLDAMDEARKDADRQARAAVMADHQTRVTHALEDASANRSAQKEAAFELKPIESLPRPTLPSPLLDVDREPAPERKGH